MPLISARLRLKCELTAGTASVLGRVGGALHAKLLEGVHGDQSLRGSQCSRSCQRSAGPRRLTWGNTSSRAHIGTHPVHSVIVRFRTLTIHTELARRTHTIRVCGKLGCLSHRARREQNQILKAAAIQRHVFYVCLIHHSADRSVGSIKVDVARVHRDALRHRPNLEPEVLLNMILDVDDHADQIDLLKS